MEDGQNQSQWLKKIIIFNGFCHFWWIFTIFKSFNWHFHHCFRSFYQHFNHKCSKLVDFNQILLKNDSQSSLSLNQNQIFIVRFESDKFWNLNSNGLESELPMIWFVGPNWQSLVCFKWKGVKSMHFKFCSCCYFCCDINERHQCWYHRCPRPWCG